MKKKIALVGNPNTGKTTLFNQLSGLHQKTGNYPGVTVEKKIGKFTYKNITYELIDLPGTYSLYPSSEDEELTSKILLQNEDKIDLIVVVGDVHNMKRSLFLYNQITDLKIPTILTINQIDDIEKEGISIIKEELVNVFENPVILISSRKGTGIEELKNIIHNTEIENYKISEHTHFTIPKEYQEAVNELKDEFKLKSYIAWGYLTLTKDSVIPIKYLERVKDIRKKFNFIPKRLQLKEIINRHQKVDEQLDKIIHKDPLHRTVTQKIDKVLLHPILGYLIFFAILFVIFQGIFFFASFPQEWIEEAFSDLAEYLAGILPKGPLSGLITKGIIPGISGICVFIPQIAILFLFLLLMEESGYMARIVFLMDRIFKPFGLSGKSVVPLLSGAACAIPAVLSARNIENPKERLITILVTPFITCSARLPVYAIIISLVIPNTGGFFNLQGIVFMILYLLGVFMAFIGAFIAHKFLKSNYKSFLVLDMPVYKLPFLKNVLYGVYENSLSFVVNAGKIIFAMSIILWALGTYGNTKNEETNKTEYLAKVPLKDSYLGSFGQIIEPAIKPLGYDWKIGIGILSSFVAREVFVGTIASIYSLEDEGSPKLRELMKNDINVNTGKPTYNLASGISLLLFYAFAMQCLSTLAVVKKETNTWKWPLIQLIGMTAIAYIFALFAYQFLK